MAAVMMKETSKNLQSSTQPNNGTGPNTRATNATPMYSNFEAITSEIAIPVCKTYAPNLSDEKNNDN